MSSERSRWASLSRRLLAGGVEGNERLTALAAFLLLALLAAEGVTILQIGGLLTPHEFIGMLLIPPVLLKLGSTSYRTLAYYRGSDPYVRKGPPQVLLRIVVAPVLVLTTVIVFGSGVALLVLHERQGTLVGIHKASFVIWIGAFGLHVLAYALRLPRMLVREWSERLPGRSLRYAAVLIAIVVGVGVALGTLPLTDHWRDHHLPHQVDLE